MRKYLFRGKRINNGEWVEGTLFQPGKELNPFIMLTNKHGEAYEVDPETVGQYTGMKDKNGKNVFEGDIVGVDGKCYEVLTEKGCWIIVADGWDFLATNNDEIEVIGNIHDNPELLKEGGEE